MHRFWILCGFLIFSLFSSCNAPQKSEQKKISARINIGEDPNTLDPRKAHDLFSQTLARMFFEGLTRVGKNEKAELALAKSVSISSDLKTYTFHLKEAKWSNGDSVTAFDFIHAWKTLLDPAFPSHTAFQLYVIKNAKAIKEGHAQIETAGMRALDEKTLEVELEYSVPYFLELVAIPAFFPVNVHMDHIHPHWAENPSSFVCNGPFQLEEWKHNDRIVAVKNTSYWDASAVQLSALEFIMVTVDTELKMFEKGQLDWAGSPLSTLSVAAIHSLKKNNTLKTKEMLGTYFIRVNTQSHPFQHPLIRKAFAMAIYRKDIVDHVTQGNQIPASGFVPLSLGLQQDPYFQDGAVEEARRLFNDALASLHLDRKSFPAIKLLYAESVRNHLIAQVLEQQWYKAFGIRVQLESCERKVYFDRLSKQDYDLASSSWIADFSDPINFLDVFRYKKGSSNNTEWENAQYAELLRRSSTEVNPNKRIALLKESEKVLIEEMPILPIFYFTMLYLQQPHLKDVVLSSMGVVDFKWATVAK